MTDKIFFWLTLWSIAGPELPKNLSQIAKDIQIRPRIAAEVGMEPPYIPPELIVKTTSGPYVVHYPPRDEVHGSHMIQINIDATSQDDAIRKSEQVCARLTASLSLVVGGAPYFA